MMKEWRKNDDFVKWYLLCDKCDMNILQCIQCSYLGWFERIFCRKWNLNFEGTTIKRWLFLHVMKKRNRWLCSVYLTQCSTSCIAYTYHWHHVMYIGSLHSKWKVISMLYTITQIRYVYIKMHKQQNENLRVPRGHSITRYWFHRQIYFGRSSS